MYGELSQTSGFDRLFIVGIINEPSEEMRIAKQSLTRIHGTMDSFVYVVLQFITKCKETISKGALVQIAVLLSSYS
jgi:hypothetical protein